MLNIWMGCKQSLSPNITVFKEMINMKYKTQLHCLYKQKTLIINLA